MRLVGVDIRHNAATIRLDGVNSQLLSGTAGSTSALQSFQSNSGELTIRNGRDLTTTGGLLNAGTLVVGAESTLTVQGVLTNDGLISGTGRVVADRIDVGHGGRLAPGNSIGTLAIDGSLYFGDGSVYQWQLGPLGGDLLQVDGVISFEGTSVLDVSSWSSTLDDIPSGLDYVLMTATAGFEGVPDWQVLLPRGWSSGGVSMIGSSLILSSVSVPEPSALALTALLGAVGLAWRAGHCSYRRRARAAEPCG